MIIVNICIFVVCVLFVMCVVIVKFKGFVKMNCFGGYDNWDLCGYLF